VSIVVAENNYTRKQPSTRTLTNITHHTLEYINQLKTAEITCLY